MNGSLKPGATSSAPDGDSSVRVGPMVNIAPVLGQLGADPEAVFGRAGLTGAMYSDPEHRVTYLRSGRLFAECVAATGCEHFGLLAGQAGGPSHLGLAGFLVRAAPTVGDALAALAEYLDLHDEGGTLELSSESGYCQLSFHVHQPGVAAIDQVYDFCAAIMQNTMRMLCGADWTAAEVMLPRRKPADPGPYRRFFRTVVLFDADICAISFPCHWLEHATPTADSLLYRHLEDEARALHRMQEEEITATLPAVIKRGLMLDRFSAVEIAEQLGLRERTFHRRLQAAGTNFRQELDRVRKSLSMQLLESTSLPICDIAQSLGYADSSSFIRAFNRWCARSPSSWRRLHKSSRPSQSTQTLRPGPAPL